MDNDITTTHPDFDRSFADKCICTYMGNVVDFIPKLKKQTNIEYENYRSRGSFYNVLQRTTSAVIGAMTRKPCRIDGMDTPLVVGNLSFDELLNIIFKDILLTGRCGLFVDYDEEHNLPYINQYNNNHIINWFDDFIVLKEHYMERDDHNRYKLNTKTCYRELIIDDDGYLTVNIWKAVNKKFEIVDTLTPTNRGVRLDHIPFVFVNAFNTTTEFHKPVLLNLTELNISHFKSSVDVEHAAHFTALPQPYMSGELKQHQAELAIGTNEVWMLEQDAKVGYLEFSGDGIGSVMDLMTMKESQMSSIGSRLLQSKKGVESVESLQLRSGAENATLNSIVTSVENGLKTVFNHINHWNNIDVEFEFELNKDFTSNMISPQEISSLMDLLMSGAISQDTFLARLQEGEIIDDVEIEKQKLSTINDK